MQTHAPHVPYAAEPVSIETAKAARRRPRRPATPSPALLDVRGAAQTLTTAGHTTFTAAQLYAQLLEDGHSWGSSTVPDLLHQEAIWRPDSLIERVSYGKYRLRVRPGQPEAAVAAGLHASDHVLVALRELGARASSEGGAGFTATEVHQHLSQGGIAYNRSHLSRVLARLSTQGDDGPVVRLPGARYRARAL